MRSLFLLPLSLLVACASAPTAADDEIPTPAQPASAEAVPALESMGVVAGMEVLAGPTAWPTDTELAAIRAALDAEPAIRSGRLFQMTSPDDAEVGVYLVVEVDGPRPGMFELVELTRAVEPASLLVDEDHFFQVIRADNELFGLLPVLNSALEVYVRD